MPIEVMENIIGTLPDNVTVVDPFMGSGTTGLACKNLKVDFIGMEMDEEYFKIAKERMSK
jgi:site-specific DNA-methyltransferase (adenine-specific)